jgi:hypothetical protein
MFIVVVLKKRYMFGSRIVIAEENNPKEFVINIVLLTLGYILTLLFAIGWFLQETGYLARY